MNGNCFDIGTIQAFLDGEATQEIAANVTHHVAACDTCALVLAEAEEQNSVVFSALGREMDTLVPTQRLWSRINDSIAEEKSRTPFWKRALAFVNVNLANPSFAAAAGILIVFGVFAAVWNFQSNVSIVGTRPVDSVASPAPRDQNQIAEIGITNGEIDGVGQPALGTTASTASNVPSVIVSKLSENDLKKLVTKANFEGGRVQPKAQHAVLTEAAPGYLPGEESYVKTIADLKQNVDSQKDETLRPSSRISYERDMAVVNDSIKKMREVVRKNPRNQAAKQVLYSSYQNKIDLLNSVVEREELMASLK
jgi:anti-sigma factor RsiW